MMCHHFGKHNFLELRLKLLQQFQIELVSLPDEFTIIPGDCSKFSLKCTQCGKCVSPPDCMTFFNAPSAILIHLKMTVAAEDHMIIMEEGDPSVKLELVPILLTTNISYCESVASFVIQLKLVI